MSSKKPTIKSDRVNYEALLNGIDPVNPPGMPDLQNTGFQQPIQTGLPQQQPSIDNPSADEVMNVKVFEYDYDGTRKGLRKKARKTVLGMVAHIVPDDIIGEEYIQDKIEQDIETLTEIYMQLENNKVMQKSLMDNVSRGNCAPRMYEVFAQLTDKMQAITKQIGETEARIRKTYVDLKFEVRDKANEIFGSNNNMIGMGTGSGNNPVQGGVIVTSTKNLINGAKSKHNERARIIQSVLDSAKETEFSEEKNG